MSSGRRVRSPGCAHTCHRRPNPCLRSSEDAGLAGHAGCLQDELGGLGQVGSVRAR